nr:hypothetical protein BaRGS_029208 [Batillaria attramentaria]
MAGCPLGASGVTAIDSALVANTHAAGIAAWGVKQGVTSHGTDSVLSVTAGTLQHLQGSCSVCRKAFDTWKALRTHYYSNHRMTNFCDKCKLGFASQDEMKAHCEATHGTDTHNMAFICDICNKEFLLAIQGYRYRSFHSPDVYKALLEVFPKGKLAARTVWQVEFMHFPKQQQCAIDLMDQMEDFGVIPDHDFGMRLEKVFGTDAHAFRKYRRMMYWMPKFKHANPYPAPHA